MRVITGKARGIQLKTPEGMLTRPTADRVKEALFSIINFDIPGARVLDLFGGTGQLGIEALSRGAQKAVFVELDRNAIEAIKQNVKTCKFTDSAVIYKDDVFHRLKWLETNHQFFDIIYLDPPFTVDEIFIPVLEAVANVNILNPDGIIAIRTLKEKEMPEVMGDLYKYKMKTYGISAIHFYCKDEENK